MKAENLARIPSGETIEISDKERLPAHPVVSVYMLAYRHEWCIAEAIEGVIAQQCDFPVELIIGEDCSPDNTRAIALDYQRRYPGLIRVLTSEGNVGAHANARRCQIAARGDFVAICEGDDFWHHPRKLQMQVDLMLANPDMTFCHTDYDHKTRFRTRYSKHKNAPTPWLAKGDAYLSLLHDWSVITATTMCRRDVLEQFRDSKFDNPEWPFGDLNRSLFASLKGRVGYIDISTATYRKVAGSSSNAGLKNTLKMKVAAEECINMFLDDYPVGKGDQRKIVERAKLDVYRAAFFADREDVMKDCFHWLKANGFSPDPVRHKLLIMSMRLKIPAYFLRAMKTFVEKVY